MSNFILIASVGSFFSGMWDGIKASFSGTMTLIKQMAEAICSALVDVVGWLVLQIAVGLDLLVAAMPEEFAIAPETIASCLHYLKVLNAWVDISTFLLMGSVWTTFMVTYVAVKFVRRCIPTAG